MTYLLLNAIFLAGASLIAAVALGRRLISGHFVAAVSLALALTVLLTAVFDNLMIGAGLFSYEPAQISGVFIGLAPIEDFAYPLAAAILLPALWALMGSPGHTGGGDVGGTRRGRTDG